MRVDKYLWFIRIFRSRNIATNACKKGKVKINSQVVKPSSEILPLDIIEIKRDEFRHTFKVLDHPKSRLNAKLVNLYCVEITEGNLIHEKELKRLSAKVFRDKGTGRPTKKERRDIDELNFNDD
tara:strand:+ start:571 stop:942 length:372 start_codon:yes stop_codon:yes gene_type:complete